MLVVMNRQLNDRTADMRRDTDDVGAHIGVIGTRIHIVESRDEEPEENRADYDRGAEHPADYRRHEVVAMRCVHIRHFSSSSNPVEEER